MIGFIGAKLILKHTGDDGIFLAWALPLPTFHIKWGI